MTDFRTIAPANNSQSPWSDSARPSTLSPSGNSTSTGSTGRTMADEQTTEVGTRRRRRVNGPVSQNACTECRKARSKCDGDKSRHCTRCLQRGLECLYQPHTKIQKDDILSDLDSERLKNSSMSIILDILTNNGQVDEIIKRLQTKQDFESIAKWLRTKPELQEYADRNREAALSHMDVVKRVESLYSRTSQGHDDRVTHSSAIQWTRVSENQALISHLLELYFLRVHPYHMLFNEISFLDCYHTGKGLFCSSPLVNAICAMACHLLDGEARTSFQNESDIEQLQAAFLLEARSGISPWNNQDITTLQTFAVLFLADLSSGKARNAVTYLRCAADSLLGQDGDGNMADAFEVSRWGIHTLNTMWSGFTYQKPFNPQSPDIKKFLNFDEGSSNSYVSASQSDLPRTPGFAIMTATQQTILFRIVHGTINMYCGASGKVVVKKFLKCYHDYIVWKENLPPQLQMTQRENPLSYVLGLHLQYYTALTELFSPLLGCFDDRALNEEFRSLILANAREGRAIIRKSLDMGICRFHTPPMIFCVVHVCDAIARCSVDHSERVDAAVLCLEALESNRLGFKISGPLLQMFHIQLDEYGVELPAETEDRYGRREQFSMEEVLDACTRLSYIQPSGQLVRWIDPSFQHDWRDEWQRHTSAFHDQQMSDGWDFADGHVEHRRTMSRHSMRLDEVLN